MARSLSLSRSPEQGFGPCVQRRTHTFSFVEIFANIFLPCLLLAWGSERVLYIGRMIKRAWPWHGTRDDKRFFLFSPEGMIDGSTGSGAREAFSFIFFYFLLDGSMHRWGKQTCTSAKTHNTQREGKKQFLRMMTDFLLSFGGYEMKWAIGRWIFDDCFITSGRLFAGGGFSPLILCCFCPLF